VFRLLGRVSGRFDPDVRPPDRIRLSNPEEITDDSSVRGARDAGSLGAPQQALDLRSKVLVPKQRLGFAVTAMARLQQCRGAGEVLLRKRVDFESRDGRRTIASLQCRRL
jgi:hypothetical protein